MAQSVVPSAIVGIVDRPGRQALMLRRFSTDRGYPSQWCFPGGRSEQGESTLQGAIREVEEETGFVIVAGDLVLSTLVSGARSLRQDAVIRLTVS